VLDFLLGQGLKLKRGWEDRIVPPGTEAVKVAMVEGVIPVVPVVAHFAVPGKFFPRINLLEIRPDHIRVVGLAFEEYLISTS
jgi:hypothetical protein